MRAAVRVGLEAELARPAPRGTCVLARALGVTTSDLNRQGALYKRYIEKRRAVAEEHTQAAERNRARRDPAERERRARVARLRAAFRVELARPTPRSPRAVLLQLGLDPGSAKRNCSDLYCRLRDVYAGRPLVRSPLHAQRARDGKHRRRAAQRDRQERVAKVEAALRAELREQTPRSPSEVLAEIGVTAWIACHHCRDLFRLLSAASASGVRASARGCPALSGADAPSSASSRRGRPWPARMHRAHRPHRGFACSGRSGLESFHGVPPSGLTTTPSITASNVPGTSRSRRFAACLRSRCALLTRPSPDPFRAVLTRTGRASLPPPQALRAATCGSARCSCACAATPRRARPRAPERRPRARGCASPRRSARSRPG